MAVAVVVEAPLAALVHVHTPPLQRDALSQVGASALAALAAAPLVQCFEVVAVAALSWLVAAVLAAVLLAAVLLVALARLDPTSLPHRLSPGCFGGLDAITHWRVRPH